MASNLPRMSQDGIAHNGACGSDTLHRSEGLGSSNQSSPEPPAIREKRRDKSIKGR
jgi:hypothetical protein